MTAGRLRVAIATPLAEDLVAMMARTEPRLDIDHRPRLMAPATADWMTRATRTESEQTEYDAYVDGAEALFGVPDQSGRALARTVAANPRLRWVHTIPAGGGAQLRSAGLSAEQLERIVVTTSAGVHAQPLAEFALFGVLAGIKQLPRLRAAQARHEWAERRPMGLLGETTVAVVGLGGIGRRTAELLAGLGVTVVGVHRHPVETPGVSIVEPVERLGEVLSRVDAVVLALPATDATERMLGGDALRSARPGLAVINVGRGSTIDEHELVRALADGRVGSATLDVTAVEPLPPDSPLWDDPRVVISPHTAAISEHEPRLIAELFVENARRLLDDEPLVNVVNTVEFY